MTRNGTALALTTEQQIHFKFPGREEFVVVWEDELGPNYS